MATADDASSALFESSGSDILEGASLSERFKIEGRNNNKCSLSVTPVLVDFRRLLQQEKLGRASGSSLSVIPGISNGDLLHAVIGLYDTSLSEMTPDVLYSTVCDKWARTIILIRDVKDVFLEFERRRDKPVKSKIEDVKIGDLQTAEDKYSAPDPEDCTFSACYSDTESEEEEDSDEEDDFSVGMQSYLKAVSNRRKLRSNHTGAFTLEHIGPENRIVAACTFDKKFIKTGEKIIHLTLVTIRKRFRRLGLGKYLLQKVKDPTVAGPHDAVVVHAESEATSFFARYGFSDDVILNNRWREIAEQFTNCTLMSFIPPYSGQAISGKVTDFDLLTLDQDLRKWKDRSIEAYQAQLTVIERMKAEMIRLRSMVTSQEDIIHDLKSKIHALEAQKSKTDRDLMLHKLKAMSFNTNDGESAMSDGLTDGDYTLQSRYQVLSSQLPEEGGDNDMLSSHLTSNVFTNSERPPSSPLMSVSSEQELRRYMVVPKQSGEVYDHGKDIAEFHKICEDFKSSLKKDPKIHNDYTVTSVSKAILSQPAVSQYADTLQKLGDTSMVMKLYFCGPLDHPEKLKNVLKNGFSDADFVDGDYGRGLYFSRYASTAVHFSTGLFGMKYSVKPNKVLCAEVIVGKCQTLISQEKGRRSPDDGYNSILCPGRLLATCGDGSIIQEYIIFDANQALPLDLIEFTVATAANAGQVTEVIAAPVNGDTK